MHTYRVAQRLLSIDPALPEMALRRADDLAPSPAEAESKGRPTEVPQPSADETVFCGDGQLGTAERHIECRWSPRGYSLEVDGVGRFRITEDGRRISRSDPAALSTPDLLTETVLGPAMTLALALQEVWCLHAGAIECGGEVVAFLGSSGAGKSTLARELPRLAAEDGSRLRLRCAADDVLPVSLDGGARALPKFPQLKYRLDHQPGDALPAALPLRRIYVLDASRDGEGTRHTVDAERLTGSAAVLALVRHTVAARLFCKELLKRHMDFCVRLAEHVEIARLRYPHQPASLGQTRELLFPSHHEVDVRNVDLDVDPL